MVPVRADNCLVIISKLAVCEHLNIPDEPFEEVADLEATISFIVVVLSTD